MSTEQKENLDAILRQSAFPADSDVSEQRRLLRELTSAQPLPADVTVTAAALGGVPTAEVTVDGIEPRHVVLYFHGGVYVLGDAFAAADLASRSAADPQSSPFTPLPPQHPRRRSNYSRHNPSCGLPPPLPPPLPCARPRRPPPPPFPPPPPGPPPPPLSLPPPADPRRSGRGTGQSRTAPVGASRQRRTRHRIASGIASQAVPRITEHSSYAGGLLGPMLITALALAAAGTAWSCPHDSAEAHTIAQRESRYRGQQTQPFVRG